MTKNVMLCIKIFFFTLVGHFLRDLPGYYIYYIHYHEVNLINKLHRPTKKKKNADAPVNIKQYFGQFL